MHYLWIFTAGILGFLALILDAIGAHALHRWLAVSPHELNAVLHNWQTATRYQLVHALLMIMLVQIAVKQHNVLVDVGAGLIVAGTLLFCGGIYIKILSGNLFWGRLAPLGGVCFMLAWLSLAVMAFRR